MSRGDLSFNDNEDYMSKRSALRDLIDEIKITSDGDSMNSGYKSFRGNMSSDKKITGGANESYN
jgi:hypothetical protein